MERDFLFGMKLRNIKGDICKIRGMVMENIFFLMEKFIREVGNMALCMDRD